MSVKCHSNVSQMSVKCQSNVSQKSVKSQSKSVNSSQKSVESQSTVTKKLPPRARRQHATQAWRCHRHGTDLYTYVRFGPRFNSSISFACLRGTYKISPVGARATLYRHGSLRAPTSIVPSGWTPRRRGGGVRCPDQGPTK